MVITFLPVNKKIETVSGVSVEAAAVKAGIETGAVCNGRGTCGKCKVMVTKGNDRLYTGEELKYLTDEERERGFRLACCFSPLEDTCVIINKQTYESETFTLGGIERDIKTPNSKESYGVVLDIGTTTLEAILYHINSGQPVLSKGMLNPQRIYGGDVVSRITYSLAEEKNTESLQNILLKACNKLINELASQYGINVNTIKRAAIAGNTTMTGLFLGRSLQKLSRAPFQQDSYKGVTLTAREVGVNIQETGSVFIMPGIGGHVGGDTMGCILSTRLYKEKRKILLMDIGTNGEMVLCNGGRLTACSTAAGPAFEGGNISCGMRAENGAITSAKMVDGKLELHYIGEEDERISPTGICGSGIIECIFELYTNHSIDETGRLLGTAGDENLYRIWKRDREEIILTQKDIREFQLATGAIKAGIALLLQEAGLQAQELDKVYLAGNFGSKLSVTKAIGVGLLPEVREENIEYIGNGALAGSAKLLLQEITLDEAEAISQKVLHLDLSGKETFEEEFIKALSFPVIKKTEPSPQ
jgi:uncharacterized 2Fe-2S/4Fe-4S cluster protein (DUF4445 family)